MKEITVALLISTYNWKEALELVLMSVKNQSVFPDEILIADDGSKVDTKNLIEGFARSFPKPVIHIWHEDNGFRKTIILNKAIAACTAQYIIQLDGDCILHKHFIKDHIASATKGKYVFGSRCRIEEDHVNKVFGKKKINFNIFSKDIKARTKAIRFPFLSKLYALKTVTDLTFKLRGCNIAFWRADILAVNGYNETMVGWGMEDSELVARLIHSGIYGKRLRYKGLVFHIHHTIYSRDKYNVNDQILNDTIKHKTVWANNGIDKYLKC